MSAFKEALDDGFVNYTWAMAYIRAYCQSYYIAIKYIVGSKVSFQRNPG